MAAGSPAHATIIDSSPGNPAGPGTGPRILMTKRSATAQPGVGTQEPLKPWISTTVGATILARGSRGNPRDCSTSPSIPLPAVFTPADDPQNRPSRARPGAHLAHMHLPFGGYNSHQDRARLLEAAVQSPAAKIRGKIMSGDGTRRYPARCQPSKLSVMTRALTEQ
jgi:hypothetical protein